ncbi:proline racemase family protein [Tuwongella immobilis]|uniref:4-hydroxyproline epimerase n=1 Tax=Tuwongella immobilis TaxID=692036 RepID=A0A6C2YGG2_9BACT|nr:proline racemase family protein [Tuwongella immobilis]VIP00576.1 hydroxyproline-2-epimerase : 4-hydroxyproline epimerase OS=Ktedonobacter racemifer DSM 44963 GN=Krac_10066 PE=4 SV=1: Pro_racemase [Tuwongella immobilis]VTR96570.1 hydroxyproline-2-epimerase : 4-hydroxyproline epimerase OS=Ktedonobacter racemifer DSM 44963 GN=Krac_10066 PE=4 SV=1: Pro_racemase [Tuwongella immobilis]
MSVDISGWTMPNRVRVIDSHTGGEPTRTVIDDFLPLGTGSLAERCERFRREFDPVRSALVCEPRGSDVLVGALLVPPSDPSCVAGVIFFNNVSTLGMCGHGTIGVGVTLGHLGRIRAGTHRLETPVGIVPFDYDGANTVTLSNVPSYRLAANVAVDVMGLGLVRGDIAWGGNWFFLVREHPETLDLSQIDRLTDVTWRIRQALWAARITGANGAEIDHIELFGPPGSPENQSRNFVLCPGKAYDRSPCGTGTSAKVACLAADGKLKPGELWRQESILGSVFTASYQTDGERVLPVISGQAFVTGETTLIFDAGDPFREGIRA